MTAPDVAVRAKLARLSYKPGWEFALAPGGFFQIQALVPDVYHHDTHIELPTLDSGYDMGWRAGRGNPYRFATMNMTNTIIGRGVPDAELRVMASDDSLFLTRIKEFVWMLERHEVEEFLRFDGARVDEPHPELVRQ